MKWQLNVKANILTWEGQGSHQKMGRGWHSDTSWCKSSHVNAPLPGCIALNDNDDGDDNDIDDDDDDDFGDDDGDGDDDDDDDSIGDED